MRTCKSCGCELRSGNPGPNCSPCDERIFVENLDKPRKQRQQVKAYRPIRGTCDLCERDGLVLSMSKFGLLCQTCISRLINIEDMAEDFEETLTRIGREVSRIPAAPCSKPRKAVAA